MDLTVRTGCRVNHMHCSASGAEIHPFAERLHVVLRILAKKREMACRLGDRVLDESPWKAKPALLVDESPPRGGHLDTGGNGVGKADLLEHIQGGIVDFRDVRLGQRPIAPTFQARPDRADGIRKRL